MADMDRIAEAKARIAEGYERLNLSNLGLTTLEPFKENLEQATSVRRLILSDNPITDVAPIGAMTGVTSLDLSKTLITDITAIAGMTGITWLDLESTQVSDLSPLRGLTALFDKRSHVWLGFARTAACALDPKIADIAEVDHSAKRARKLFAYLKDWVPPGEEPKPSVENLLDAQDLTGWRFSKRDQVFELYAVGGDLTERQRTFAQLTRQRLEDLLNKLCFSNLYAIREDVQGEAERFSNLLGDNTKSLSENALALWASLIALGGHLEANDVGRRDGRDSMDLLKPEEKSALQTFLAVGSNLVRSFPDTAALDDAYTGGFNRASISPEVIVELMSEAVTQGILAAKSGQIVVDVAELGKTEGVQGDKAHGVSARGVRNLVTVAAIAGTATASGLLAGVTGDVGGDISDHYELGEKSVGYLDSMSEKLNELINGLPPDEKAILISLLEDLREKRFPKE